MSGTALRLEARHLDEIRAHARACYPLECCGMVFGPTAEPGVATEVRPIRNVQDDLHASDPENYPRNARTAYVMDAEEQSAATKDAEARGLELRAFFHSHPDHGVYFSEEDRRLAAPEGWGELHPGVAWIVVSVAASGVIGGSQFLYDGERDDYAEVPIEGLTRSADRVLDLGDTPVPQSLIEARDALRMIEIGQVLEVVSRDRASVEEAIPGYCEKQRLPVDRIVEEDRVTTRLRITRMA